MKLNLNRNSAYPLALLFLFPVFVPSSSISRVAMITAIALALGPWLIRGAERSRLRLARIFILTAVLLTAFSARAVERQTLQGHVPRAVARLKPLERLPATNSLHVAIGLPVRNPELLANLLQQLYDPASGQYRQYLTAEQFTERFGPTEADYQAVAAYAQANGLSVKRIHPNRRVLDVVGAVADIERAFHVTLHVYPHPTEARTFYAPDVEPSLDLATSVLFISGLNDYRTPQPMLRELRALAASAGQPRIGSGPSGSFMGKDFRSAYVPGTTLTGAGQAVGLFELDGFYSSDITDYATQAGLPNVAVNPVLIDGFSGTPVTRRPGSGNEEVALDIEMAISMAPGLSQVLVYEGSPTATGAIVDDILNRMATDNQAKALSASWGFDIDAISQQTFLQFAAQGQSFFLASGDNGAFSGPIFQPSDDPNITVVGGTELTTDSAGNWSSEVAWNGSGGGISTVYSLPDWQQGVDMSRNHGSTTMRNLPDVAMLAHNAWVMADRGRAFAADGTSIAAPLWAGFIALVNQQAATEGKAPVGFVNRALYAIGKSAATTAFHDITTGNNTNSASPSLFYAASGYDLCTGWGSPNGTALINALLAPPLDPLLVASQLGFYATGPVGGPFNISSLAYSLTNTGSTPLSWSANNSVPWLVVTPTSGTLAAGAGATVTVALSATANKLLIGTYTATVSFANANSGVAQPRQFSLLVGNGSFETGDFSNWTFSGDSQVNFADYVDFTQENGGSSIQGYDDSLFIHSGIYGAFLGQSGSLGTLSQTLPTVAGQSYTLSFWLANPAPGTPNRFQASWNGTTLFDKSNIGAFGWTNLQFKVTATTTSTALQFGFQNDNNAFGLDDISVQGVSAPVAASAPELLTVSEANGVITFTWSAVPGSTYQIQSATTLVPADWSNFGAPATATASTVTASDTVTSAPQRWYRVVLTQ